MKNIYELRDLCKKVAKKSKSISFSITVLISLLMNGEISISDLGYGKFVYENENHSNQLGVNYYLNIYNINNSMRYITGEEVENIEEKELTEEEKREKFYKYKYPNDVKDRYSFGITNTRLSREKEISVNFYPKFNPIIKEIESLKLRDVEVATNTILTETPIALFPTVDEKEINLLELPKLRPTEIGYNEVPTYMVGFGKKKRGYFNEDVFIESIGKVSPSFEGNYYIEGSPHYNYVKALENKAGNNSDKGRYIEKYEKLNGGLISQLDLVSGEYNLLFKGYEKGALIDDYEFTYDESKDRVLKRIEKDKNLTKEEREKKKAEYIEKQKKAVEKYNSKARKKEYAYEFNIKSASFTPTDEITDTTFPEEYRGSLYAESFYRHSGKELSNISKDVNINVVGKLGKKAENETEDRPINSIFYLGNPNLKEYLVNKDFGIEGEDPTKLKKNYHNITDHQKFMEGEKIVVTKKVNTEASKLVTEANINLYGEGIIVANIDNVHSIGDTHFENQGTIIGHNDRGTFKGETEEIEGNEANKHIFGGFSYGDFGNDIIENGKNGKVLFYAPNSVGWSYSSASTQNIVRHAINKGEFKLYGKNSIGIGFVNPTNKKENYDPHQVSFANIQLENPIEILGDNSIGIDFSKPFYSKDKKETISYKVIKLEDVLNRNTSSLKNETGVNMPYSLLNMELDLNYNYSIYNYIVTHLTKKDDGNWYYKFNDAKAEGIISVTPKVDKKTANNSNKPKGFYDKNDSINTYRDGKAEVDENTFKFYSLNGTLLEVKNKKVVYPETTSPLYDSKLNIKIGGLADKLQDNGGDILGSTDKVQNSVGLNFNFDEKDQNIRDTDNREITNYKIELADDTKNSTAIRVGNADIKFSENDYTSIKLGGENNIAFLSDGLVDYTLKDDGSVEKKDVDNTIKMGAMGLIYNNTLHKIENTGKNNIIFLGRREGKLYIENKFESNLSGDGLTLALAVGNEVEGVDDATKETKIHFKKGIEGEITGKDVVAFYSDRGYIHIDAEDSTSIQPTETNGHIKDSSLPEKKLVISGTAGIGAYAKDGVIEAEKIYIKLEDGATGVYSKGEKASLKITNSIIDYNGNGYAVYSQDNGKIELKNSTVILRGKAIGYTDDTNVDLVNNSTKFVAMSNDIYVKTVKDKGNIKLSTLVTDLGLSNLESIPGEKDGEVFDKYKEAYINGVEEFLIDENVDKKLSIDDSKKDENVYKWLRKYAFQKTKLRLSTGKYVDTYLNSSDIDILGKVSVIGLNMSSSDTTTSIEDTGITLETNSEVRADRIDDGTGAIGLFVNYGKITTEDSSKVIVEKSGQNEENKQAVGIYAVNGTVVENKGDILVGGENSVGILGLSYRIDKEGNPQKKEFKDKVGSGVVELVNKGKIELERDKSTGIFIENNNDITSNDIISKNKVENLGTISLAGKNSVGIVSKGSSVENKSNIEITGEESYGILTDNGSNIVNTGMIKIETPDSEKISVGIVSLDDDKSNITHKGNIEIDKVGYGIYSNKANVEGGIIKLGEKSAAVFIREGENRNLVLDEASKIEGRINNVGIYSTGNNPLEIDSKADIKLGENSFSYFIESGNTTLKSNTEDVELKDNSIHIISLSKDSVVLNNTNIDMSGDKIFGIYTKGKAINLGNISSSRGIGSVALYSQDDGIVVNGISSDKSKILEYITDENEKERFEKALDGISDKKSVIDVGRSDRETNSYGIAMAAGSLDGSKKGIAINYGIINAKNDYNLGMYASGRGSKAINYGEINLSGRNSIGMYLINGAIGENYGTIQTVAGNNKDIMGVFLDTGSTFKNYGKVIISGATNKAIFNNEIGEAKLEDTGTITVSDGAEKIYNKEEDDVDKDTETIKIVGLDTDSPKVILDGVEVDLARVDKLTPEVIEERIKVNDDIRNIRDFYKGKIKSNTFATKLNSDTLGMYIDTSGIKFTNPIEGIDNLEDIKNVDLIIGVEASNYTNDKAIEVGENILKPYNDMIENTKSDIHFKAVTSKLTWIVTSKINPNTNKFERVYLVKVPYVDFADDEATKEFLKGLDEMYSKVSKESKEKQFFNKLNELGKGEIELFTQTVEELRGNIYGNTTRRVKESKITFDREFDSLLKWSTKSKETTKYKVFGDTSLYKAKVKGLKDYNRNAVGIYILDDNKKNNYQREGGFIGLAYENFVFNDSGKSKEQVLATQFGYYKDYLLGEKKNHRYQIRFGVEGSLRDVERKVNILGDDFKNEAVYGSYGAFIENEIATKVKLGEKTYLDAKAELDLGYGRITSIIERNGALNYRVNPVNYLTIVPKLSVEINHQKVLNENWNMQMSTGFELFKDFGYSIEKPITATLMDSDKQFNLAKDKKDISAILSAKLVLDNHKKNHSGYIIGAYDFGKGTFKLGAELKFNLDREK